MSISNLAKKTAFLLALTSASRPSDLHRISIRSMTATKDGYVLQIQKPKEHNISIAHGGKKSSKKSIAIGFYKEEPAICPASVFSTLLNRTSEWRLRAEGEDKPFLSLVPPHNAVSVDTISRWIKSILTMANPTAKAKDPRAISANLAQESGADISSIVTFGNCSSNEVYQKFYQRGIRRMLEKNNFPVRILDQARQK
ncbi:hypothetical protein C2G38_2029652 [Gigaspora rosea]|uniref:Tyr recombinase domain-containing protein n=1 Tax=Gigaspora rosea TaxID=44941 RepID=A0A397VX79_9GLOM|nr:hypothetical protein C2G38_2029652 [Gigaspora rosea]